MDVVKANKRKVVKKAVRLGSIKGYMTRYKEEIKEINMAKKYVNRHLKKQLNAKARELRDRIKLLKSIEENFSSDVAFEVKGYYEKHGFEGVVCVLEAHAIFPSYNFLTINAVLDYVDWMLNKNF